MRSFIASGSGRWFIGVGLLAGLGACSSSDGSTGSNPNPGYLASGGAFGVGGAGGALPGGGGVPGGGLPGAGGFPAGGAPPNAGGAGGTPIVPGGGGTPAGGAAGGGAGGAAGGPTALADCDMTTETSAKPITEACGSIKTPTGTTVKLGALGASMDVNVGKGFENADPADMATCPAFVNFFNEAKNVSDQLLDVGPQPCTATAPNTGNCLDFKLYTVYRPATWPDGKIPVLSWGNGTCAQPEGYGTLLRYIASQGYFIVAANSREVGSGTQITHGIDFAAAANADPSSPYYGHLDLTKVGVMGHSQGSTGAGAAAADSRVQSVILFNLGTSNAKPFLAISGDLDITGYTAAQMKTAVQGAAKGAYLYYHNPAGNTADGIRGHLVLMLTPERVTQAAAGFWDMMLKGDATAKTLFVGDTCGLCGHSADYEFGEKGL